MDLREVVEKEIKEAATKNLMGSGVGIGDRGVMQGTGAKIESKGAVMRRGGAKGGPIGGVLTSRDRLACLWVCEQGAMTVDQLWRAVWWSAESSSARYAYERVLFLERAGFLSAIKTGYSLKRYFRATRKAQEAAADASEGGTPIPFVFSRVSEILHTDGLTELRIATLRANKCVSWRSDRVLVLDASFPRERFYGHVPDAVWSTASGRRVAVEYERTRKGAKRVRQKVEAFARELARPDRAFDRVLWVAEPGVLPSLQTALGTHPEQVLRTKNQFLAELAPVSHPQGGLS